MGLPGSRMICGGILCQIIGLLYNDLAFDNSNYKTANQIAIALDYLNRNYSRSDLKISELAEITGVSEKHFRRLFFDIYKKKPHEFLRDFRLNKAELMILNTSKQISDIAFQCGFSDVYYFCKVFKNETGTTPAKYKKEFPFFRKLLFVCYVIPDKNICFATIIFYYLLSRYEAYLLP